MEFWEGAILVIGGVWLVGRMTRSKTVVSKSAAGTVTPTGNTTSTNTDGSSALIAGEPLTPSAPAITGTAQVVTNPITSLPTKSPITAPGRPKIGSPIAKPTFSGKVIAV